MNAMTKMLFSILALSLATSCYSEPVIELDVDGEIDAGSLAAIRATLSPADKEAFNKALQSLVLRIVFQDGADSDAPFAALMAVAAQGEDAMEIRRKRAASQVEGLSASEVIKAGRELEAAADERKRRKAEAEREAKQRKAQAKQAYLQRLAAGIRFDASNFRREELGFFESNKVDITVENKSSMAIAGITYKAEVRTPGRTIPWADDDGMQVWFSGGIEPTEIVTEEDRLSGSLDRDFPEGAVFTATVECAYGAKDEGDMSKPLFDPPEGECSNIRHF